MGPGALVSLSRSLAEILAHQFRRAEPLPVPVTLAIWRQVCDALATQPPGVVHGNLSPAHIMISEAGVQVVSSATPHSEIAYIAPEYLTTGMFDARGDVFALGVVAYEMLANRPLFLGSSEQDTLDRVCSLVVPPPSASNPDVIPDLDGIVLMALVREPAHRWQHVTMIRDVVHAVTQRFGLDVSTEQWAELLDGLDAGASASPPRPADLWADDDDDGATRIEAFDPAMLEALAAAHLPGGPSAKQPPRVRPVQPVLRPQRAVAIPPLGPPRSAAVPNPTDIQAALAAIDMRLEPPAIADALAAIDMRLEPEASTLDPNPAPPVAPAPVRAPLDPEFGPEPTQMGAMPLISFGSTRPLVALVGEPQRTAARETAEPLATFLPHARPPFYKDKRVWIAAGAVAAVLLVVAILVVR